MLLSAFIYTLATMNNLFCIEILNEKPVISFDELLFIKSEIEKVKADCLD